MRRWQWAAAALVLAVLGWAWADGGREPLRQIVEPVTIRVPGAPG